MSRNRYRVNLTRTITLRQTTTEFTHIDVPNGLNSNDHRARDLANATVAVKDQDSFTWETDWGSLKTIVGFSISVPTPDPE